MKEIKVVPGISVNGVAFGCDRAEIRKKLGNDFKEVKKNIFSRNTMDVYKDYHVFYSKDNTFEAIEVFGEVIVKMNKKVVFPGQLKGLMRELPELEKDGADSYVDKTCSIALTVLPEEQDRIESILFGSKDYYN